MLQSRQKSYAQRWCSRLRWLSKTSEEVKIIKRIMLIKKEEAKILEAWEAACNSRHRLDSDILYRQENPDLRAKALLSDGLDPQRGSFRLPKTIPLIFPFRASKHVKFDRSSDLHRWDPRVRRPSPGPNRPLKHYSIPFLQTRLYSEQERTNFAERSHIRSATSWETKESEFEAKKSWVKARKDPTG